MRGIQIFWAALALVLFAAEALVPGAFMLWFGFAAAAMFLVVLVVPELGWLWQAVVFVVLSLISVQLYRQYFRKRERVSDQPLLNRRGEQLIGMVVPLEQAIVNGRGRVKIGDAFWTVEGTDMPLGTPVKIVSVQGMTLKALPAE